MRSWLIASVIVSVLSAMAMGEPAQAQQVTWKVAVFGPPRAVTVLQVGPDERHRDQLAGELSRRLRKRGSPRRGLILSWRPEDHRVPDRETSGGASIT